MSNPVDLDAERARRRPFPNLVTWPDPPEQASRKRGARFAETLPKHGADGHRHDWLIYQGVGPGCEAVGPPGATCITCQMRMT